MAKINFSISPNSDGTEWANISADCEPSEVDKTLEAVDKVMQKYPVLKPRQKKETPTTGWKQK